MITAAHAIIHTTDSDATRAFLSDVLALKSVDAGGGWLIYALPPAELAAHPTDGPPRHELFLMCEDIRATMAELEAKGVEFVEPVSEQRWGLVTAFAVPGAGKLSLYEPRHPSPLSSHAG
jgi:catechol 2,3-dioxygenase-like lactoylglutathione lyase family enzyme